MGTRKPVWTDYRRLLHVYAGDDLDPKCYWIWCQGRERDIIRNHGEHPMVLWGRVLDEVANMRRAIRRGGWQGCEHEFAHIYAGVQPSDADRREHMLEWHAACLWRLTDPQHNHDHAARVDALCSLSDLFGLDAPSKTTIELSVVSSDKVGATQLLLGQ